MKKIISKIAVAAVIVFVIYNLISFYTEPEKTIVAEIQTVEITYNFDGVVSRSERVVSTSMSGSGWFEPAVSENEMVKNGKMVGIYYDGEIDAETKMKLNEINAAIEDLSMSSDELNMLEVGDDRIDQDIAEKKDEILVAAYSRDISSVRILKKELDVLLGKKARLLSEDDTEAKTPEELIAEKSSIEKSKNIIKEEIFAPCHGLFTTHIDGFETTLNSDFAITMTVDDFETLRKNREEDTENNDTVNICKIVDNSRWWISMLATENEVKNFKIGEKVKVRISGESDDIDASVQYISPSKGNEYIITLSSDFGSEYVMKNRFMNVTVVKESYTGLEIPISAIRVKNGKTGVYVKADSTTKFRETEIVYKDDKIAIVKLETTAIGSNSLLLYDEVYVN
ncbi:MAG: hypothetical protein IJB70_06730 [Clostridia bacterium]|nr:hypothetical protein [Clostridia bacterium]